MATVTLYRCISPHWQGDTFIAQGTIVPAGSPQLIPQFFEPVTHEVVAPSRKPARKAPEQ